MKGTFHRRNRGARLTSGGRKQRLCPLIYGPRTADIPRLEPSNAASFQAGGQTRPGALRACHRAKGALVVTSRCKSPRATAGRNRPRGDVTGDCAAWFMAQGPPTTRVLTGCSRACIAPVSGPGGTVIPVGPSRAGRGDFVRRRSAGCRDVRAGLFVDLVDARLPGQPLPQDRPRQPDPQDHRQRQQRQPGVQRRIGQG